MGVFDAWRYVRAIELIPVEDLVEKNVRCVLFDRDNTCVPRDTKVLPVAVQKWFDDVRAAGIKLCMVSNNFHGKQVEASAAEIGCDVIHHAMKPAPFALKAGLKRMGVSADEAVMVGDQVFTDVVAANLAGVRSIIVRPQSQQDLWYTKIMRIAENNLLEGHVFEGE